MVLECESRESLQVKEHGGRRQDDHGLNVLTTRRFESRRVLLRLVRRRSMPGWWGGWARTSTRNCSRHKRPQPPIAIRGRVLGGGAAGPTSLLGGRLAFTPRERDGARRLSRDWRYQEGL